MDEYANDAADPTSAQPLGRTLRDVVSDTLSGVQREGDYEGTQSEKALVKKWLGKVANSEKHLKPAFKRMREDMDFAYKYGVGKQWPGQGAEDDRYIANFIQQHIKSRVSALYAKNPKAAFQRRKRLDFKLWEGDVESLEGALQQVQMAAQSGMQAPPQVIELLMDVQQGVAARRQIDRLGKTLEILYGYATNEQIPNVKAQMKQMVRRTVTCGISYIRVGYQRILQKKAEDQARLADSMQQLQTLERLRDDMMDGEFDEDSPEMEELRVTIAGLQQGDITLREGLTFDFPKSTAIIIDKNCTQLVGWIGAEWLAEKWYLKRSAIQEVWRIDIGTSYTKYDSAGTDGVPRKREDSTGGSDESDKDAMACVYKIYDRKTGTAFVVCEGFCGYLEKPAAPDIKVEDFFPIYPLAFNQIEHDDEVIPPSDVRLLRHQQREHNRSREAVRQHRIANRPLYAVAAGALEEEDDANLAAYPAHALVSINGLKEGQDVGTLLQPVKKVAIDPNVYDTGAVLSDTLRVVGGQEANQGGTSSKTSATESSIAETSRLSTLSSNVDDLDELLTVVARASGQVLLLNMPKEAVMEIVGPGAVWPEMTKEQAAKEVWLEIEAGSSGKPNKAQEMANFERVAPYVTQIPSIRPGWLAKYVIGLLDDRMDIEDAITAGMPSIQAMNGMMQASAATPQLAGPTQPNTGNPDTNPADQGGKGASNLPAGGATPGGAQPGYPAAVTQ